MGGTIGITGTLVGIMLLTLAIIGFIVGFENDNNSAISISSDSQFTTLNSTAFDNASLFTTKASNQTQSIVQSNVPSGSDTLQNVAPFTITAESSLGTFKGIFYLAYTKIFGSNPAFAIFFGVLIAFVLMMIGLYFYKTLRGNPD